LPGLTARGLFEDRPTDAAFGERVGLAAFDDREAGTDLVADLLFATTFVFGLV